MQRAGESFTELAWSCRHLVENPLLAWLQTLDVPPQSRVLLGKAAPLPRRAAWQLMRFRRDEIARMAGSWPDVPDFGLWLPLHRGGLRHRRSVCRVQGDVIERFASIDEADDCRRELENVHRILQTHRARQQVFSASDIYRDILALYEEFEEVEIDLDEHTLSVTTDRIVLEYVRLGAFEIKLDWRRLGDSQPYRVVALDPNPAAKNDDVTHPHVQDEQLCEGEGRTAIRAALAEGRLHDFFLLVSQLLHTYGQGSAYVELPNWDGTPCEDCGFCVDEDDRYCCDGCEITLCDGCAVPCSACGDRYCSGCLGKCAACGGGTLLFLPGDLPDCRQQFCEDCRPDKLCQSCHEKQEEDQNHDPSENTQNEPLAIPA